MMKSLMESNYQYTKKYDSIELFVNYSYKYLLDCNFLKSNNKRMNNLILSVACSQKYCNG